MGGLNGSLISGFCMMPVIITLGTRGIARGGAKWLARSQIINAPETSINHLMAMDDPDHFLPLPAGVWLALGLAALMSLVMRRTVFGRHVFAIGSNEAAARLCGIRVQWQKVLIYALVGLFFRVS